MKQFIIAFLLVFAVVAVNATDKKGKDTESKGAATTVLTGSISDELSGESLVGVEVKLEGTDLKTYTDFDGNFSFKNVKPGEYKITSSYISYEKSTREMKVSSSDNKVKIQLQTSN